MKKNILICIDRDGTLLYDKKLHLGHQRNWKSKIKFLPGVISGLKTLKKKIPEAKIYMITNQPGVAVKNFPLLNKKRAHEVCEYVLELIKKKGFAFDGYEVCAHSSVKWAKRHPQFKFDKKLVGNFSCMKPKPGMVNNILRKENLKQKDTKIYVVGDRASDVKLADNVKGFGIFIPFVNEPGQKDKLVKLKIRKKYIAKDFIDAVGFMIEKS